MAGETCAAGVDDGAAHRADGADSRHGHPRALTGLGVILIFGTAFALAHRWLVRWDVLIGLLILIVLFIPIRRFVLPGNLPFQLEPYRVFVALLVAAWGTSLLVDPRVRLRRTGFDTPCSSSSERHRLDRRQPGLRRERRKVRRPQHARDRAGKPRIERRQGVDILHQLRARLLCDHERGPYAGDGGPAGRAAGRLRRCRRRLSIVESRTGFNAFNQLPRLLPFLRENYVPGELLRGAGLRAHGPAEHAIALSAVLAMLVPLGVYLAATTRKLRWWLATAALTVGAMAAVSRTGVVMLGVVAIVFFCIRPRSLKRAWPALIPVLVVIHFAVPGTLGTLSGRSPPRVGCWPSSSTSRVTASPGEADLRTFARR